MPVKTAASAFATLFLLLFQSSVHAGIINVEYPPDGTFLQYGDAAISVRVPEDFDGYLGARLLEQEEEIQVNSSGIMRCFSVRIPPGLSTIYIYAEKDGKELESKNIRIFRRSDLVNSFRVPPEGFRKSAFHAEKRVLCDNCHDSGNQVSAGRTETVKNGEGGHCNSCHGGIIRHKYVHGPASVWSCLSCHEEETDPPYEIKASDTELCFGCHTEQKRQWYSKKYIHGPVNIGRCTICHSPHSSENPYNLFKPTWRLCTNCHAEKASGKHVLGDSFSYRGHPTHERPDPLRPGKELSCASCHNPHASNQPHLWAFEVDSLFDLCQKCHRKNVSPFP